MTFNELNDLMYKIENGEVKIVFLNHTDDLWLKYKTDTNVVLVVFNDSGSWDYLDWVEDLDGNKIWEWPEIKREEENWRDENNGYETAEMAFCMNYRPPKDVCINIYKLGE